MLQSKEILTSYYGEPEYQFSFGNWSILYFPSLPDEEMYEATWVTCGLQQLIPHAKASELILLIHGEFNADQALKIGEEFSKALTGIAKDEISIDSNKLVQHFSLPSVNSSSAAYITNTDPTDTSYFDEEESLRQLRVYLIHSEEYNALKNVCFDYREKLFNALPVNWYHTNRLPIHIYETLFTSLWDRILNWYKQHTPGLLNQLAAPASADNIATVEKSIGFNIPEDLKVSLMIHNGGLIMHQYTLLSISEIDEKIHQMISLEKDKPFVSVDSYLRWQANTVPFAADEKGDLICYLPYPSQPELSVFFYDIRNGKADAESFSFAHWLSRYAAALERGSYKVDEHGQLY